MLCENCKKEHDGTYGSGRFCSAYCAHSFVSKTKPNKEKICYCVSCGRETKVSIYHNNTVFCDECKHKNAEHDIKSDKKPHYIRTAKCKKCGKYYIVGTGGCDNEFCKTHTLAQIKTLIKYFLFDESKLGTPDVEKEFYKVKERLYKEYYIDKMGSQEICEKYGYHRASDLVSKVFLYLNIKPKSLSDAIKDGILKGRVNIKSGKNYKTEYHKTWNGKTFYLRSSYEIHFANFLDEQKVDYEVESLRIEYFNSVENKIRIAIPDFFIPINNVIYEIKSKYTYIREEMIDKFEAYKKEGYVPKLILEHVEYTEPPEI